MERLSGIVSNTGAASTDAALVLLPIDTVRQRRRLLDPDESTQVAIFLR